MIKSGANTSDQNDIRRLHGDGRSVGEISRILQIKEPCVADFVKHFEAEATKQKKAAAEAAKAAEEAAAKAKAEAEEKLRAEIRAEIEAELKTKNQVKK